jgi:hypothetical protein
VVVGLIGPSAARTGPCAKSAVSLFADIVDDHHWLMAMTPRYHKFSSKHPQEQAPNWYTSRQQHILAMCCDDKNTEIDFRKQQ